MLTIVLAGCEVELAPEEIAGHPAIRATARELGRKPSEVLLDQNMHGPAIRKLPEGDRRGRPDITHITLLCLLESPLNKAGQLQVLLHTRQQELIRIRRDTRLPRGEARFQGLLSKVLRDGASQDQDPLLWSEGKMAPADVLANYTKGPVIRLDETATVSRPADVVAHAEGDELVLVLGAFAHGEFSEGWKDAAPQTASIYEASLNAWAVAGEVVAAFRAR